MHVPHSRRPSAALVVATIALFVALGGTGYAAIALPAGSVGTKQLKNGAVTSAKIKAHSLGARALDIGSLPTVPSALAAKTATSATTATTATNATNATNAVNATNATTAGSAPIAKVTYVASATTIPDTDVVTSATASCPSGTTVIGGGASAGIEDGSVLVFDSFPSSTTTWQADIANGGSADATATVTAICAPAAATAG
jgi:hypothetical protein